MILFFQIIFFYRRLLSIQVVFLRIFLSLRGWENRIGVEDVWERIFVGRFGISGWNCSINAIIFFDYAIIINIFYKELTSMDFNLCDLKDVKSSNYEETLSVPTEKLISNLQDCPSLDYKLEKTLNQNDKFQINSLVLAQQLQNCQRLQSNSESVQCKIEIESPALEITKVEGKQNKRKKIISLDSLFKSHRHFVDTTQGFQKQLNFFEYARKRTNVYPNSENLKTDLGIFNTREIVEFCVHKNIISTQVYAEYTFQPCFIQEELFIEKVNRKQYDRLDFDKMYLTPFDHRLLCKILVSFFPEEYSFPSQITLENNKVTVFYRYLYSLRNEEYSDLISNLNKKYNRAWMPCFDRDLETPAYTKRQQRPLERISQTPIFNNPPRKLRKKY